MALGSPRTQLTKREDSANCGALSVASSMQRRPRRSMQAMAVGVLKTLLPSFAVGMVLLIFAWPQFSVDEERFSIGVSELAAEYAENLSMLNARFDGFDRKGRPFSISADEASQPSNVNDLVDLSLPKGDITLEDGTWMALTAKEGFYHRQDKTLDLEGEVSLFHDQGFELRTQTAAIDLLAGRAVGNDRVEGQGPFGQLESEGFRVENNGQRIIFTGRSRMILHPDS